jgi:site-specific DNA recombinase
MNALIYTRVSTDEQAERGTSLKSQLVACREYAERHGFNVIGEYLDDYSGGTLDRPEFNKLLHEIEIGSASTVIVYTADRLSRNAIDALTLLKDWKNQGIDLHYVDRGKVKTEAGILIEGIFSLVADDERERIKKRTARGRNYKAKDENKIVMSRKPNYGYRKVGQGPNAKLVIHENEAYYVQKIFEWYVRGNGNGKPMSLRAITKHLNENSVPPPGQNALSGSYWYPTTIRGILLNSIYVGKTHYGKTRIINGERKYMPKEKWIEIDVPELAMVEKSLFDAVQERSKRNKARAKRNRKRKYLLSGHIRCGNCGRAFTGVAFKSGKWFKIQYRSSLRSSVLKDECKNSKREISARKVDRIVWDWLVWLVSDDDNLMTGLQEMVREKEDQIEPKRKRLDSVLELLDATTHKIRRLVSELANYEEDEVILDTLRTEIEIASKQRNALEVEVKELESYLSSVEISPDIQERVIELAAQVRDRLPNATFEDKRFLLDALDVKVTLNWEDDKRWINVSCAIPAFSSEIVLSPSRTMKASSVSGWLCQTKFPFIFASLKW